jgi:hypothetical protein
MMPRIKRFDTKNILIDVVASALEDLGFVVKTEHVILEKEIISGRLQKLQITADVLGVKIVDDLKFTVYASCKNWDNVVESGVIREEIGRVEQMRLTPHVKVLVANSLSENAKKEGIANGFVIIEIGEKVTENNAENAYWKVYGKLNKLFTGVTSKWLQDLAEKVKKAVDEIKRIGEELERATGIYKF